MSGKLHIYKRPSVHKPQLVLGFSGWMDGGEVSTGSVKRLIESNNAKKFAEIGPEGFYINNFPSSMEITALFRHYTKIKDGLIKRYETVENTFFCDEETNLIFFLGKESNLQWHNFADDFFSLCSEFDVEMIYFIGSAAGLVPHTRQPHLFCSVSESNLKDTFRQYGVKFTNYEGPAGISTYLMANCHKHNMKMASVVATIPAYVQGSNPKCIEAVTRRLAGILGLQIDLNDLRALSDEFDKKLSNIVQEQPELAATINKLEEDYDNEIFNTEMGDLKNWLEQKGIRVD
ncbi:PAC2 family protein [Planctomycetota bacterium]